MAFVERFIDYTNGDDSNDGLTNSTQWKTLQFALDNTTRDVTDGNRFNMRNNGVHLIGATLDFSTFGSTGGTVGAPLRIEGYSGSAGDGFGISTLDFDGNPAVTGGTLSYSNWHHITFQDWGSGYCLDVDNITSFCECSWSALSGRRFAIRADEGLSVTFSNFQNFPSGTGQLIDCAGDLICEQCHGDFSEIGFSCTGKATYTSNILHLNAPSENGTVIALEYGDDSFISHNTIFMDGGTATTAYGIAATGIDHNVVIVNNYIEGFSTTSSAAINLNTDGALKVTGGNKFFNNTLNITTNGTTWVDIGSNNTISATGIDTTSESQPVYTPSDEVYNLGQTFTYYRNTAIRTFVTPGAVQLEAARPYLVISRPRVTR